MTGLIDRLDIAVGQGAERLVCAHHRRRLRRIGRGNALDAAGIGWVTEGGAVREGNRVEVLIDGSNALPAIADAIEGARRHVHVAGWHVAPGFCLRRSIPGDTVKRVLAEAAQRSEVRVLVWAGAPAPIFHPSRAEVRRARDELVSGTAIRCVVDSRERPMHCHHEKLVVVDDQLAFVGGIDLTDLAGDRFDDPAHAAREPLGWHDVCLRIEGPLVADVAAHFCMRWGEVTGERLARPEPPAPRGSIAAQLVRTLPEHTYAEVPRGDFSILTAYLGALRAAQRLVYLESQFLWSPELVAVLRDKLADPPCDDFRVVIVLPEHPNNGGDDTRGQLSVLDDADPSGRHLLVCTVSAFTDTGTVPIYVHAKVGIVDDRWMTIGSANLNEHSFFNDTEVNLVTLDPDLARATRLRLWAEHLRSDEVMVSGDPARVVDQRLRPVAAEQLDRQRRGLPRTHPLVQLPASSRRTARLLGPMQGLLVDG